MLRKQLCVALSFLAFAVLSPLSLSAQQVAIASVTGQVSDPNGAALPGARVQMTEIDRSIVHTTTTDGNGNYLFPGLPVGRYRLDASKTGFKTYVLNDIVLQVNDHVTFNAPLQIGQVTETVEVSTEAPLVQTETAAISNVIDSRQMVDLPLNGRYASQLVLMSGASLLAPAGDSRGSKSFYSSTTISVAGGQANGTNYLLDGGDNNDTFGNVNLPFPFPDALEEFSVETSALPARNGLHPGGVVNIVTKSGTNQIHGDVFDFYRDGTFNALAKQMTPSAPKPDTLLRNQFGGVIGGPIIKDKLFWFAGYQGTRARASSSTSTFTATQAALNGDFTQLDGAGCQSSGKVKPLKGPFTGNILNPGTPLDPAAVKLFNSGYVPISTDPCGLLNYSVPSIDNEDEIVGKVDFTVSQKQALFGRYFIDDFRSPAPFDIHNLLLTTTPGNLERAQSLTIGDTYTFTPTLINSVHVTGTRRRDNRVPDQRDINPNTLGINMYTAVPDFLLISSISGYFGVGCGTCAPGYFNVNTWQVADDVDWIRGKHHFAFGVDFIHTQNNTLTGYDENGTYAFSGNVTGDGLADFLLGDYSGFSQSHAQKVAYRDNIPSLYAQDTYKLTKKLTLTAGLRWEPTLYPSDFFHRGSIFNMADFLANVHTSVYTTASVGEPPAGELFYGDHGVPAAFTNNHMLNFAPRIGIAWDPTGKGNQSIRAGYGLFYDSSMVWFSQRLTSNPPVVDEIDNTQGCGTFSDPWLNYSQTAGCGTANAAYNPFPGGGNVFPPGSLWANLPPNMRPMYMQQYNLSYERQFLNEWSFSLAYIGSRSLHVPLSFDTNYVETSATACAEFTGGCSTGNETQRRLLYQIATGGVPITAKNTFSSRYAEGIGQMFTGDDTGYSNYNGLLASLEHRFRHGFSVQANYTFSHCLSVGDFSGDLRQTAYTIQTDPRLDYGSCNFDTRHIFNTTLVATSPFHGSGAMKWLLGGWQLAPSIRLYSGYPVNIVNGKDSLFDDNEANAQGVGDRPELVPGQKVYVDSWVRCGKGGANICYQVFNPAAFADPTSSSAPVVINPKVGNVYAYTPIGRDAYYGPSVLRVDSSLSRIFPIRERAQLELRFEAFNVLNKVNPLLGTVSTTSAGGSSIGSAAGINSSNFGLVTSMPGASFLPADTDPRILQFAVKIHW